MFYAIKRGGMEAVTSVSTRSTSSTLLWDALGVEVGGSMDAREGNDGRDGVKSKVSILHCGCNRGGYRQQGNSGADAAFFLEPQ